MDEEIKTNGEPAVIPIGCGYEYRRDGDKKRVGIIGAGPAGIAALRRLAQADMEVVCFEQNATIGGIWNYTESTGKDEMGVPLHAFIYRDLRTNLPKETMMFPDFPYHELEESYVHSEEVIKYLKNYLIHHDLNQYIKYRNRVIHVKPLSNCWSLTALDLISKEESVYVFDSIFVCSGPFATPVYPDIELAKFSGHQIHSKEYRIPEVYKEKTMLLIGLGPSGLDIAYQLSPFAKQIYLSSNKDVQMEVPDNVKLMPIVKNVEDKTIHFTNDTSVQVDTIIHCTGYTFHYPFLDSECGVTVNKFVFPLYKHFISIERPTMYFIGLPRPISHLFMCDFQVRAAVRYLKGEITLPSKEEMFENWKQDIKDRESKGQKKHMFHQLGRETEKYFNELSELGEFERIPPVQIAIYKDAHKRSIRDFKNFRKFAYRIKNDEEYELIELV